MAETDTDSDKPGVRDTELVTDNEGVIDDVCEMVGDVLGVIEMVGVTDAVVETVLDGDEEG